MDYDARVCYDIAALLTAPAVGLHRSDMTAPTRSRPRCTYHHLDLTYAAGGCPASRQVRLSDARLGQRMTIFTDLHAADADHPNTDKDAVPRTFSP